MTVKIFLPGPKYYANFDSILWDRDKQEPEDGDEDEQKRSGNIRPSFRERGWIDPTEVPNRGVRS